MRNTHGDVPDRGSQGTHDPREQAFDAAIETLLVFYAPARQPFAAINSNLRDDGTVGEVRFFLSWQEARADVELAD